LRRLDRDAGCLFEGKLISTSSNTAAGRPGNRFQSFAIPILFILLGVVYASWAARIPTIRDHLQLSPALLSMVLLCSGIGAVLSFPLAAWLNVHYGPRHSAGYAGIGLLIALLCVGLAPNLPALMSAMALLGVGISCFDVAINALGAAAEKRAGRSIMSLLHAWFCVGTFSGALLGSALAGLSVPPAWHFGAVALLLLILLRWCYRVLPDDRVPRLRGDRLFVIPHGPLIVLGMIAFCGAIVEGSMAGWSGVYMKDALSAGDGLAPLGYAGFAGMMLLARLAGDRLKELMGARRVVGFGALLAAVGIFIAVGAVAIPQAVIGFTLAGGGVAMVFPFVFSAAGRHGPTALAGVATLGYSGGLIGPPIVGFLAQGWGLQAALGFVGILCVGVALAASRARWLT
jgi:fucose permease